MLEGLAQAVTPGPTASPRVTTTTIDEGIQTEDTASVVPQPIYQTQRRKQHQQQRSSVNRSPPLQDARRDQPASSLAPNAAAASLTTSDISKPAAAVGLPTPDRARTTSVSNSSTISPHRRPPAAATNAAAGAAALLAHSTGGGRGRGSPSPAKMETKRASVDHGYQAAILAAKDPMTGTTLEDEARAAAAEGSRRWSLAAATGAQENSNRSRSASLPMPVDTSALATGAGMAAARRSSVRRKDAMQAAEETTSTSVTGTQEETATGERRKNDILRAATVSLAKSRTRGPGNETLDRADTTAARTGSRPTYPKLEEAARKIAEERLARIGYTPHHYSTRLGRLPVRSASVSQSRSEARTNQIDVEMQHLSEEDQKKKGQDALLLMTVARRNVQERMSQQDRKIADEKGIIPQTAWEKAAMAVAQKQSDARLEHHGKIHIGGGTYMTQEEIDALAARKVKPVIDDVRERGAAELAEKRAAEAKAEEERLDKENAKRIAAFQKEQARKTQAEIKAAEKERKKELKRKQKQKAEKPTGLYRMPTPPADEEPSPVHRTSSEDQVDRPVTTTDQLPTPETSIDNLSPPPPAAPARLNTTLSAEDVSDARRPSRMSLAEAVRSTTPPPETTPTVSPTSPTSPKTSRRRLSSLGLLRRNRDRSPTSPVSPTSADEADAELYSVGMHRAPQPSVEETAGRSFLSKLRRNMSTRQRRTSSAPEPRASGAGEPTSPPTQSPPSGRTRLKSPLRNLFGRSSDNEQKKGFEGGKGFVTGVERRNPAERERQRMVSGEGPGSLRDRHGSIAQESRFTEQL